MSKKQRNIPQYSRPTKAFQNNMAKNMMRAQDVEMPKQINMKKITRIHQILLIVWAIAVVAVWVTAGWKFGLPVLILGAAYVVGYIIYMNRYQRKFLAAYKNLGILKVDPFEVLDQEGVGQLVEMATTKGRAANPELNVGICGEHGGEPSSVKF